MSAPLLPLELLAPGQLGRVALLDGDHELVHRLAEMGLRLGVAIRMIQPGSPCIVAVGEHRLSFRGETAASVFVEVTDAVAGSAHP